MSKKNIIMVLTILFAILIVFGSILFMKRDDKLTGLSEKVVQGVIKNDQESIATVLGPLYYKNITKESNLEQIHKKLNEVMDYTFESIEKSKQFKKYKYSLQTRDGNYDLFILFSKQPKKWLVEKIYIENNKKVKQNKIIEKNKSSFYLDEESSLEDFPNKKIVKRLVESLADKDYGTIYNYCSESYANRLGFVVENAYQLEVISEIDLNIVPIKYDKYRIKDYFFEEETENLGIIVEVISDEGMTNHLVFLFDGPKSDKLIGIYSEEHEFFKDSLLYSLDYDENLDSRITVKEYEEEYNDALTYMWELYDYYSAGNFKVIYGSMTDNIRKRLTHYEFSEYMRLLNKRVDVKKELYIDQINITKKNFIDEPTMRFDFDIEDGKIEASSAKKEYITLHLDTGNTSISTMSYESSAKESVITGIYLNRYYYAEESNEEILNAYYANDQNYEERDKKIRELIKALRYKDYDYLWKVESKHSGLDNKEEFVKLLQLQEKIVGSFNAGYREVKIGSNIDSNRLEVCYVFETFDGNLNNLIIGLNLENEILDFNVVNIIGNDINEY